MQQYLDMVRHILAHGNHRGDRTGTGTQSVFGYQNRYNLQDGFPLMTSKFVPIRLVAEELLWFLSGSTDNKVLANKNVHIWDDWALKDRVALSLQERYDWLLKKLGEEQYALQTAFAPLAGTHKLQHAWLDSQGAPSDKAGPQDGDLGPIYSAQFRSWPGPVRYKLDVDYRSKDGAEITRLWEGDEGGVERVYYQETIDQIAELITGLKERPFSRRHVVSAWNPANLPIESQSHEQNVREGRQALPPCHCLFQFYVRERAPSEMWNALIDRPDAAKLYDEMQSQTGNQIRGWFEGKGIPTKALSCQLYQRSADVFLGVPFNIASYALLTEMIAQCVGMAADEFVHTFGDLHIYNSHREQLELQLSRKPYPLPKLRLDPTIKNIFDFKMEHIKVENYQHHPAIKGVVSV